MQTSKDDICWDVVKLPDRSGAVARATPKALTLWARAPIKLPVQRLWVPAAPGPTAMWALVIFGLLGNTVSAGRDSLLKKPLSNSLFPLFQLEQLRLDQLQGQMMCMVSENTVII